MLRLSCCTAVAVLVCACAEPRHIAPPSHGAPPGVVADDPGTDDPPPPPSLTMSVVFREPGQHVVLNTQAGDTLGAHPLVTVPSDVVAQPFALDDTATQGGLSASAHLDVVADDSAVVVHATATFASDTGDYSVAQAGPLPVTVCAAGDAAVARISLVCEGALSVTGNGIAALWAASGAQDTQAWCNGADVNGDNTLIPFTSPSSAEQTISLVEGKACWDVDVYVGSNAGDQKPGSGSGDGTFTFTADAE